MSLMNYKIRPKSDEDEHEVDNTPWSLKSLEKKWKEYNDAFYKQFPLMQKELGCVFPVESHRLLLKAVVFPEKTKGGIIFTDYARDSNVRYDIGLVIGAGPESYKDKERFPLGPRCKVGDWIDFSPFEKQSKKFNNIDCYIINDDRVNFTILDITKVVREYRGYNLEEVQKFMEEDTKRKIEG